MHMKLKIATALLALIVGGPLASAGDWSQWRGPEQNGVSREKDLPVSFDPFNGENVAWHNPAVSGMSSPIVMKGKLYTWTRVGEEKWGEGAQATIVVGPKTQEALVCVDTKTGKTLWEYKVNMTQT